MRSYRSLRETPELKCREDIMAKEEFSTTIDRSVEDVWKFVMDLSNEPTWNPQVVEPKWTSTGPVGVGTTAEFKGKMGNSTKTVLMRVTEYELGRRISMEHITGPLKGTTESETFEAIEGKTRFTRRFDLKYSGFFKLLGPFVTPSMRRGAEASMGSLKRALESEAH
jgi:uncharacterized protein YndB with AHSA1/START domain